MPKLLDPPHYLSVEKTRCNFQQHLVYREMHAGCDLYLNRRMYQFVTPCLTLSNVSQPDCFLRKFSPDGKYLLAASRDMKSVEIYRYLGPAAMKHIYGDSRQWKSISKDTLSAFNYFFKLVHSVPISLMTPKCLNRESGLFTADSKYFIIGASQPCSENTWVRAGAAMSSTFYTYKDIENYSLYMIHIETGKISDRIDFNLDKLMLSHNQSMWLYGDTLAILSYLHQSIHIYKIGLGRFEKQKSIGRFAADSDLSLLREVPEYSRQEARECADNLFTCLQQKLLAYLLVHKNDHKLRARCYESFGDVLSLTIWRMQLLTEDCLLLKMVTPDVLNTINRTPDVPSIHPCLFIVYNHVDAKIISVMDNISGHFLALFERYADQFISPNCGPGPNYLATISNNYCSKVLHNKYKNIVRSSRQGGEAEASKRSLGVLPFHCQCYTPSPYTDLTLFEYDDKMISIFERPRGVGDCNISFSDRLSGDYVFTLSLGLPGQNTARGTKKLTAIIFHPYDPFAISVQRVNSDYMINMHVHRDSCIDDFDFNEDDSSLRESDKVRI